MVRSRSGIDRLGDIVVRPHAHRIDGGLDRALRGEHHHDAHAAPELRDAGQQIHAVHARHLQVGDDDRRRPLHHLVEALHPVGGAFGAEAPRLDQLGQPGPRVFLIFYDQDLDQ